MQQKSTVEISLLFPSKITSVINEIEVPSDRGENMG